MLGLEPPVPGARSIEEKAARVWPCGLCVGWAAGGWQESDCKRNHIPSLNSIKIDLKR